MQNLPKQLYSAAQIRQAERVAIEDLAIPGLQLMRNAGQAAFSELQRRWPDRSALAIFCGAGNNGGDGFVIARLAMQFGYAVSLYAMADVDVLKGDAQTSYRDFLDAGGKINKLTADWDVPNGVIVDAMMGTGLNREVNDDYSNAIAAINANDCPVLAVDVPSGLHANTGCVMGCAVKADMTVTFIGLKSGLFTGHAADYCGEIVFADLAVPEAVFADIDPVARLLTKLPLPPRPRCAHKGYFGHVLLIGGNRGYGGAIRLAGEAALRSGAGLVSIASRADHSAVLNMGTPELMCHGAETPEELQTLVDKANVIVIGPGLGQDKWAQRMLDIVLEAELPCVVDADGLNLLAKQPTRRDNWILTPHPGEAARLLGCSTRGIGADRFATVAAMHDRFGGVCVLKGAGSLITDGQATYVATTGNPGMASGGMGDVLAGVLGGVLAQGLSLIDAAKLAVYVHGEAADRASVQGERGMLASDLLPEIRRCLNGDRPGHSSGREHSL